MKSRDTADATYRTAIIVLWPNGFVLPKCRRARAARCEAKASGAIGALEHPERRAPLLHARPIGTIGTIGTPETARPSVPRKSSPRAGAGAASAASKLLRSVSPPPTRTAAYGLLMKKPPLSTNLKWVTIIRIIPLVNNKY